MTDTLGRARAAKPTPHDERLKLDRRIHNQRVALRENWEIMERRAADRSRMMGRLMQEVDRLCAEVGADKPNMTIFGRLTEARRIISGALTREPSEADVERVARAIAVADVPLAEPSEWHFLSETGRNNYRVQARAAIAAIDAPVSKS